MLCRDDRQRHPSHRANRRRFRRFPGSPLRRERKPNRPRDGSPNGLFRLGEEFLDVPIAQGEAQIEPNRMLDDPRRKAVPAGILANAPAHPRPRFWAIRLS